MNFIQFNDELINLDRVAWIVYNREDKHLRFYLQGFENSRFFFEKVSEEEFKRLSELLLESTIKEIETKKSTVEETKIEEPERTIVCDRCHSKIVVHRGENWNYCPKCGDRV